jgi:hypothetical protein
MPRKPTATDAELLLKLYDLRREAEIRKARNWWLNFWPENAEDVMKVATAMGTQENAWLRQAGGYWEMAASLVNHGIISEELFLEPSFSGEMIFIFAKVYPFLNELREKMESPTLFRNVEKLVTGSETGKQTLALIQKRQAALRKKRAEAAQAKAS